MEKSKAIKVISNLAILMILLYVIFYLCRRYTEHEGKTFALKIETDIKINLFEHFQNQDFSFYDERKVGKLMSHITMDAYNLTNVIVHTPEVILSVFIRFSVVFTFLFFYNKMFGLILLGAFVLNFIFMWYILPKIQKANKYSLEAFSNISSDLEENLSGIKMVKSFANEQIEIEKFTNNNKTYLKAKNKAYGIESIFYSGMLLFVIGISPIVTIVGSLFIVNNFLAIGDVIAFILYVGVLESPLWDIVSLNEFMKEGIAGFNRIFSILEIKPRITNSSNAISLKHVDGIIEFKNVFFKYDKMNKNIFEKLNLKINAGEYIALIGSSGIGKSTFGNLIQRFYDVLNGEILIDNKNIKEIKLESLRKNIGFVNQETFLFSGSILENIRYGKPNATDEKVIEAAKNAYAHDFIMKFPDKYETQIGQRGTKLSGGQKQRLSIARVFLKNPPILIFDEATSSLDNESERFIQKSMEKLAENRTTIVIAHRLSTIKNAHRIIVLSDGKISKEITYEELKPISTTV
jgi:ATP-binding cassette subfamily B protein